MDADREAIKAKIAKLMAMAIDGRGNEYEAEAAMRHAEKLMRKHRIEIAEVQEREGRKPVYNWSTVSVPAGAPRKLRTHPTWFNMLTFGIGIFTDVKVILSFHSEHGAVVKYQGDAIDVEYAVWLTKFLRDEIRNQSAVFDGDRVQKNSFRNAFASRVQSRMRDMVKERNEELTKIELKSSNSTALTVVNDKIAQRDAEFGKPPKGKNVRFAKYFGGYEAGIRAGDNVRFDRPISGNRQGALV